LLYMETEIPCCFPSRFWNRGGTDLLYMKPEIPCCFPPRFWRFPEPKRHGFAVHGNSSFFSSRPGTKAVQLNELEVSFQEAWNFFLLWLALLERCCLITFENVTWKSFKCCLKRSNVWLKMFMWPGISENVGNKIPSSNTLFAY
jgi:hypothetical protein